MKHSIFAIALCLFTFVANAQNANEKYVKAMEKALMGMDTLRSAAGWQAKSNDFERIAQKEPNEWLPAYYVAYCQIMVFNFEKDATRMEALSEKADLFLGKAEALQANNSELFVIKSMAASLHIRLNPMANGQKYGMLSNLAMEKAQTLDPENPRVYLEQGITLLFTPEQWGGDKKKAKELFELATKKFEAFKPASSIHPSWGASTNAFMIEMANK